jgi:hypothetical protein
VRREEPATFGACSRDVTELAEREYARRRAIFREGTVRKAALVLLEQGERARGLPVAQGATRVPEQGDLHVERGADGQGG